MPLDIRMMNNKYVRVGKNTLYASYAKVKDYKFIDKDKFVFPDYDPIGHEVDKKGYAKYGLKRSSEVGRFL
jgi:hypothetical protein